MDTINEIAQGLNLTSWSEVAAFIAVLSALITLLLSIISWILGIYPRKFFDSLNDKLFLFFQYYYRKLVFCFKVNHEEILSEINQLKKENESLRQALKERDNQQSIENIADIDSEFNMKFIHTWTEYRTVWDGEDEKMTSSSSISLSWQEIFRLLSPYLREHPRDSNVKHQLESALFEKMGKIEGNIRINDQDFQRISIQLKEYGLISTESKLRPDGDSELVWSLTTKGEQLMTRELTKTE